MVVHVVKISNDPIINSVQDFMQKTVGSRQPYIYNGHLSWSREPGSEEIAKINYVFYTIPLVIMVAPKKPRWRFWLHKAYLRDIAEMSRTVQILTDNRIPVLVLEKKIPISEEKLNGVLAHIGSFIDDEVRTNV